MTSPPRRWQHMGSWYVRFRPYCVGRSGMRIAEKRSFDTRTTLSDSRVTSWPAFGWLASQLMNVSSVGSIATAT